MGLGVSLIRPIEEHSTELNDPLQYAVEVREIAERDFRSQFFFENPLIRILQLFRKFNEMISGSFPPFGIRISRRISKSTLRDCFMNHQSSFDEE